MLRFLFERINFSFYFRVELLAVPLIILLLFPLSLKPCLNRKVLQYLLLTYVLRRHLLQHKCRVNVDPI